MRGWIISSIGGLLVFATHSLAPLLSPANVEIVTAENDRGDPDFALIMSRWVWWGVTFQDVPNIDTLSDHARETLRPIVNTAIERAGLHCQDNWMLTDTFDLTRLLAIAARRDTERD